MLRHAVALALGALVVVACTAFSASDAVTPDGGGADASASEASLDGPDGGRPPSPDAQAAFCANAGVHDFCEDFDEQSPTAEGFVAVTNVSAAAGFNQISNAHSTSAPDSLFVQLRTATQPPQGRYILVRPLPPPVLKTAVIAFDLFVDTLTKKDAASHADSVVVSFGNDAYRVQANVTAVGSTFDVDLAESYGTNLTAHVFSFAGSHALGMWHHLIVTVGYQTPSLALSIDGATGMTSGTFNAPPAGATGVTISLGSQTDAIDATVKVYFDNLTVDLDRTK